MHHEKPWLRFVNISKLYHYIVLLFVDMHKETVACIYIMQAVAVW